MQEGLAKNAARKVRGTVESVVTTISGQPPRRIRRGISPLWFDFRATGRDQVEFLAELAGLQPSDRVLDIGCGVGRLAIPLSDYLGVDGSYDGFDVAPYMIAWCRDNITATHPNFRFHTVEVESSTVGTTSQAVQASEYRFAFDDETFDLAYAGSLFTHLTDEATRNYLSETARVLRPGGRLVATFNVYNSSSMKLVAPRRLEEIWPFDHGRFRLKEKDAPESNVAYDETFLRECVAAAGLVLVEPLRPDASYSPARAPKRGEAGANLWYSLSVIAVREQTA